MTGTCVIRTADLAFVGAMIGLAVFPDEMSPPDKMAANYFYGTSIDISLPAKLKLGRFRPFINFAAVCDSAVIIIGSAIDGSAGT